MPTGVAARGARTATRAAIFTPIAATGRAEAVAQRLADAIQLGLLDDGERLPTESELGRSFGVATVTARDALESLRAAGLVETRRGRGGGSFVIAGGEVAAAAAERLGSISRVELRDLALHYGVIAAAAAERAAKFASPDEAALLLEFVTASAVAGEGDARRAENAIRLETSALSRSVRLVHEQLRVQAEFAPLLWLALAQPGALRQSLERHRATAQAICASDPDAARRSVLDHVDWIVDVLLVARSERTR